jgi:hypothetical protein
VNTITASVDRDSVSAGDDCEEHAATFETSGATTLRDFVAQALQAAPLASISTGEATWLIDTDGAGKGCIGVAAQQWPAPRFLLDSNRTVEQHFGQRPPALYFRYWCQAAPEAVFSALLLGEPLPPKYR